MQERQQGCGVVNLFVPVFMAAGAYLGWLTGRHFGVIPGILGGAVGLMLGTPALGLVLLAVLGIVAAADFVARRREQ